MPDDPTSDEQVSPVSGAATEPVAVVTEPVEVVTVPWEPTVPPPSAGQLGDDEGDLADDEWPIRSPRSGLRLKYPTAVLVALLIGAGGLWGGAALQRAHGTTGASSGASSFARLFGSSGFSGVTRGSFPGVATTSAAAGIVTTIEGNTLYVTTATGGLVKVTLGKSTTYTREAKSTASAMQPGDTVIVQGTTAKNGTVTATSVADTAAGVSAAG
ncbi:MAG: hypothetical protein ACLQRM_12265 [Acidimicrobiales bacterium]